MRGMCAAPEAEQGEGVCLESMSLKASLNRFPLSSAERKMWDPPTIIGNCSVCHQCSFKALWIFICGNLLRSLINRQGKRNRELVATRCLFSKQELKATGWKSLSETVFWWSNAKDSNLLTIQWCLGNLTDSLYAFSQAYLCVQMCRIKLSYSFIQNHLLYFWGR